MGRSCCTYRFPGCLDCEFRCQYSGRRPVLEHSRLADCERTHLCRGLIWITDLYFFPKGPGRVLRDEKTGERVTLANRNDFFFIPMKWWGLISAVAGVAIFATNTVPGP